MAETPQHNVGLLAREYKQWRFCQDLLAMLQMKTERFVRKDHSNMRIRPKIQFGRWLMTLQFYRSSGELQIDERYPLLPQRQLLGEDSVARKELIQRIQDTFKIDERQARTVAEEMLHKVGNFLQDEAEAANQPAVKYEGDEIEGMLKVGEFKTPRCVRIKHLVREYGEELVAILCLRYHHLGLFRGGESGLSATVLNAFQELANVTHVGFSSPLNFPLLGRQGVSFCSLFADTFTRTFGCLGDFFEIELAKHPGGWLLDPPFIEVLLDAAVERVEAALRDAEPGTFWFVINFPLWEDSPAWQRINASCWKTAQIEIKNGSFIQQDSYGACYQPDIKLCLFVLGRLPENVDQLQLRNQFSVQRPRVEADWVEACESL